MPFIAIQSITTWKLLKKFYTRNQGWILEEANKAIVSAPFFQRCREDPLFRVSSIYDLSVRKNDRFNLLA